MLKHWPKTWHKKKAAGSIDPFFVAFNLEDRDLFSVSRLPWSWWRASVLMATLCSQLLLRLHKSVLPTNASRCRAIPIVRSATKSKELAFMGLADLCWRRSRRARRKSDAPLRSCIDQVWRAGFQRAVYECRWWDGQAWRISLTCYILSGRCWCCQPPDSPSQVPRGHRVSLRSLAQQGHVWAWRHDETYHGTCKKMCRLRSWGHGRERPIQEASWRWLPLLFDPERPRQLCVWCPSINLFQFAVVDT